MSKISVLVAQKKAETKDICLIELLDPHGGDLPPFEAGSHIDIFLPGDITRQYSLLNDPAESHHYLLGVLRDPASRGGSEAVHTQIQEGQLLEISPPKNHFALSKNAKHHILLAGGIGVTPILSMAHALSVSKADFELHYCARSQEKAAFVDLISNSEFSSRAKFYFDDRLDQEKINLEKVLATPEEGIHLYVCGPKGFMDAVLATAREAGWVEDSIHYEFFGAALPSSTDENLVFQVKINSTGQLITIPSDRTVVQALSDAGVEIQMSCEQGVCGTCITRVLDGLPDHRDLYLTPEEQSENDQFTPCCSRSKTPVLVLDL